MKTRKLIRKTDILLIFGLIMLGAVFYLAYNYFNSSKRVKAELVIDGKIVKEISVYEDSVFELEQNHSIILEVKNGKIRFMQSDCPDKICVNTGFISKSGQSAVCLPNRVSVRIVGDDDELDGVAG